MNKRRETLKNYRLITKDLKCFILSKFKPELYRGTDGKIFENKLVEIIRI